MSTETDFPDIVGTYLPTCFCHPHRILKLHENGANFRTIIEKQYAQFKLHQNGALFVQFLKNI
jgi:hypothetical protein